MSPTVAVSLGRLQRAPAVCSAAVAGAFLAGTAVGIPLAVGLVAALAFAHFGAAALNDAYDAPLDAVLRPRRPIPCGAIDRRLAMASGYMALLIFVLAVGALSLPHGARALGTSCGLALLLAGSAVLYDTAHEGNPVAPVLLGICRALAYLVAAQVAAGHIGAGPALAAAAVGAYWTGLSVACDREAGARLWPLLLMLAPFLAASPLLIGGTAASCLWFCGLAWVGRGLLRLLDREFDRAWLSLFSATPLIDAMLLAQVAGATPAVWLCAAAFPATFWLLRLVPED